MIDLNPQQLDAVQHKNGPLLVFAGAGSGKTRVIVARIAYLIKNHAIPAYNILAVTFTNKAASEMKERIGQILDPDVARQVSIGTFHAICARILRMEHDHFGLSSTFTISDESEQLARVKRAIEALNISTDRVDPKSTCEWISRMKNRFIPPENLIESAGFNIHQKWMAEVFIEYERQLKNDHAVDFDDLIIKVVQLLEENLSVRDKLQDRFRYIMIDEYQDTNHAQYRLVKLLASRYRNIMAVGDDDQSIYGWRGAEVSNILSFSSDFSGVKTIKLEQNYRSTQTILAAASALMTHNANRTPKTLWTTNPPGEKIHVNLVENERAEARVILDSIQSIIRKSNRKLADFAIFYRINSQSRVFEEVFMEARVPYRIVGNIGFFKRKEIKDLLSYIRLILNPKDSSACLRVINNPRRGIGDNTQSQISRFKDEHNIDLFSAIEQMIDEQILKDHKLEKVNRFMQMIHDLIRKSRETSVAEFMDFLIERSGYRAQFDNVNTDEATASIEIIDEFLQLCYDYSERTHGNLNDFADYLSLYDENADRSTKDSTSLDTISLMTLHNSKGLEFPFVFICGVENGLIPLIRSGDLLGPKEMEEERRLLYVGLTRARERLFLSITRQRRMYGNIRESEVSSFIREIPAEHINYQAGEVHRGDSVRIPAPHANRISAETKPIVTHPTSEAEFRKGDRVRHSLYGNGLVLDFKGTGINAKITISFDRVGIKKLVLGPARLIRLN